jgi:hypothetical protein
MSRWEVINAHTIEDAPEAPRQVFSASSFHLSGRIFSLDDALPYFPSDVSRLEDLQLDLDCETDDTTPGVVHFLSVFSSNKLRTISIGGNSVGLASNAEEYRQAHAYTLPPAFFTGFPRLEILQLYGFGNLAIDTLVLLATSSPSLQELDLSRSLWTFGPSDFEVDGAVASRGEQKLVDFLGRFPNLTDVDLGLMPYPPDPEDGEETSVVALRKYCEGRGLDLTVQGYNEEWEWEDFR